MRRRVSEKILFYFYKCSLATFENETERESLTAVNHNRNSRRSKQEKSLTKRLVAEDCLIQLHLIVSQKAGEVLALCHLNPLSPSGKYTSQLAKSFTLEKVSRISEVFKICKEYSQQMSAVSKYLHKIA